ncbi:uncharacterized protein LOC134213997 isoform X1 [Armigeres subalbatus]|uniref:uncharacterized protein LOC134213997 isoform X1 n=1 Tax=Armigeres subalbatus TaxID=124917 RepID=UPI002ED1821C
MPTTFIPHANLITSESTESTEPPYPTIETIRPTPHTDAPDHQRMLQEMTFHAIHSRLLEIDLKMSRLESNFCEAFSRIEANVAKCYRAITSVNESIDRLNRTGLYAVGSQPRDVVMNQWIRGATNQVETASLSEHILNSPTTSYTNGYMNRRRTGVLNRLKNQVKSAFSVPCVVTPTLVIYPNSTQTSAPSLGTMANQQQQPQQP